MSQSLGKTLLLVEDEVILAMTEKMQLEKYGYTVVLANTGEAAITAVKTGSRIDLILMDINLGNGIDGTEAASLILKERDIPIVFLSSHTEPEIVEKTEKITSYGYVVKNSSITVLDASIKMAFKLFEAKRKEQAKENALMLSEAKYRHISENTSDGIIHFSVDGRFDYVSPSYLRQLGCTELEEAGQGYTDILSLVHPDDRDELYRILNVAVQEKARDLVYSYRIRHASGFYIWREDHAHFMYDNTGRYSGAYVSCRDITDRKKIEEELNESRAKAEMMLNVAAKIIMSLEIDGKIVLMNDSGHAIFGYEPPDLIGKNYFTSCLPPENREAVRSYMVSLKPDTPETVFSHENEILTKSGARKTILWHNAVLKDTHGRVTGLFSSGEDISDRKLIEEKLKTSKDRAEENERQLKEAQKIAKIGHWQLDVQRGVFKFSDNFYSLYHTSAQDVGGYEMTIEEYASRFVHPYDRQKVAEETEKATRAADPAFSNYLEHRILYADGGTGFVSVRYFIEKDESGTTVRTYGVNQDISEQKNLKESLLSQRNTYEQIIEQSLAGYWDWDIPSGNEYLSPTFKKMFGYDDHEIANSADSWQALIFADDLPKVRENFERHIQSGGKIPYYNEVRYHHKDGSTVWVICTGKVIVWDDAGKPVRMIGCHIDITQRKLMEESLREREEKYKFALEGSNLGEWDWNYRTGQVTRNARWAEMLGYTPEEIEGTLQKGEELRHPDDIELIQKAVQDHLSGLTDHYSIEYRMRTKSGNYKWIHDCGKIMVRDEAGLPLRLCGTHADIDAEKRARETIDALLKEKDILLKEVHHRIKNSMNTVCSLLSLQENLIEDAGARMALKDAGNRIRSVSLLYDKLYKNDDCIELSLQGYLSPLVDDIIANFPNSNIVEIRKNIQDVPMDTRRLQSVGIILNELITDMMKYAFKGRAKGLICISAQKTEGRIQFVIEDDGVGIPQDIDFQQSPGFGLQLVFALIQQLDGTIGIERNKGTRFILSLAA